MNGSGNTEPGTVFDACIHVTGTHLLVYLLSLELYINLRGIGFNFNMVYLQGIIPVNKKMIMRVSGFVVLFFVFVSGCGLQDYRKTISEKIAGSIYVINLNRAEHPGYFAVFLEKSGFERHLLREGDQIDYLTGDDQVIMIKTKGTRYPTYYEIFHKGGDSILAVSRLSEKDFEARKNGFKEKYHFVDQDK